MEPNKMTNDSNYVFQLYCDDGSLYDITVPATEKAKFLQKYREHLPTTIEKYKEVFTYDIVKVDDK
jgi:hypothetical protein